MRRRQLAVLLLALCAAGCKEGILIGGTVDGQPAGDGRFDVPIAKGDQPISPHDGGTTLDQGVKGDQGTVKKPDGSPPPPPKDKGLPPPPDKGGGGLHNLSNLFFLHHSTGDGLVVAGDMRGTVNAYNSAHGTSFAFWDHGYNSDGLRDAGGNATGTDYAIPNDNTDPDGLHDLWTSSAGAAARQTILAAHQVIAFKSCFPASAIPDQTTLDERKTWYLAMRSFFDTRTDRLFVVMSTPPLHRLATNTTEAKNARAFASWLCSPTYLQGHPNLVCFNLFDKLAAPDDGSAGANRLRYEFEEDHGSDDSHPNALANQTVGPAFATFLINSALAY